ncbi:uncharacterized protein J3D65DRAFT_262379 [Phyllosticta citribraziliensis]|uniref:Uncharacterized protein n=1 Tax=Phyllosticta citribraziliensis TaxID=989973 RepID=A0ABR1M3Q6_9PEZI
MASTWGAAVRAVHLKVHPRPLAIGESREFLRVLQQFGEVNMFRHLKYDHNSAPHTYLAIFRHEDAASKLLKASPLRVTLDPILPDPDAAENHPLQQKGRSKARTPAPSEGAGSPTSDGQHTTEDSHLEKDLESPEFELDTSRRKKGHEEMTRASKILFEALDAIDVQREAQGDLSFDALVGAAAKPGHRNQDLDAGEDGSAQDDGPENNPPQPLPTREFDITIDVSDRNHRDAISSQVFWSTFTPKVRSLSFLDLTSQGVSPNIADVSTHPQPPSRVFEKIRRHAEMKPTLMQLWDAGPDGKKLLSEWSNKVNPKKASQTPRTKPQNET